MRIVVVGLGFGSAFVPIYQAHPDVEEVGLCEPNATLLNEVGDREGIAARFQTLGEVLDEPHWDAVHLLSPVPLHVEQTLQVLESGKHCACAVPMATEIEDLRRIVATSDRTGKNYMMMETAVYDRNFFFAQTLLASGQLGNLTFLRGTYHQDLEGSYPSYWSAQPPMHYATHVVGPILALAQTRVRSVVALGSGRLRSDIQVEGGNPFPLETALFRLDCDDLAAEVTRSWFQTARQYVEAFHVYGDRRGFEWSQLEEEDPVLFTLPEVKPNERGRWASGKRVSVPYRPDLLPIELHPFAEGGHGGSHPHLAHEFVRSVVEGRPSAIDARTAADWCAPGICAHESALREGERVEIPRFD